MLVVGLTGGIGSGKTFVAKVFSEKKIPVYNSDSRAKELMESNMFIRTELVSKFGSQAYNNNKLNRTFIANKIFSDKELINWINNIVHPIVQKDFEEWLITNRRPIVVKEAAILIESGAYKQCDKIIVVTASTSLRIKRVVERDNLTPQEVENRINNQITDTERLRYADYTIINDGTKLVSDQVEKIIDDLIHKQA